MFIDTVDVVPKVGDEFVIGGFRFKVRTMRRRRIQTLQIVRLAEDADTPSDIEQ